MNHSDNLLKLIGDCLPQDDSGHFLAFSRSISVKDAIAKGDLTKDKAEASALKDNDPSGLDANGKPLEQSDVVHDFLAFLAAQMIELNKQKQAEVKKFLSWLEAELQIQPDAKGNQGLDALTNKTAIHNFLGDYQKDERHLDFSEFWQVLQKNKKRMGVELSPNLYETLRKYYQLTLHTLLPIKEKLKKTDWLIDQIVYKLYGLTLEEIKIVEGEKTDSKLR
jgi:hypothetical protein